MTKNDFLKATAIKGYDIGFGAKKNFASNLSPSGLTKRH